MFMKGSKDQILLSKPQHRIQKGHRETGRREDSTAPLELVLVPARTSLSVLLHNTLPKRAKVPTPHNNVRYLKLAKYLSMRSPISQYLHMGL